MQREANGEDESSILKENAIERYNREEFDEAIRLAEKMIRRGCFVYNSHIIIAKSYRYSGKIKKCLSYLMELLELYPESKTISNLIYICNGKMKNRQGQIEEIERFCSICKNNLYDELMIGLIRIMKPEEGEELERWSKIKEDLLRGEENSFQRFKEEVWDPL